MKKYFKRFIGLVLAGTMIISTNIPAFAGQASTTQKDSIIDVLSIIEHSKDLYGLSDIDFEDLKIGNAIQVYNYINNEFVESRIMYPLVANGKLVAFAKELKDGQDVYFQINVSLADKVSQYIDSTTEFSIVYDKVGCYIYYNGKFQLLFEGLEPVEERSVISENIDNSKRNELVLSNMSLAKTLEYVNNDASIRTISTRYECPVPYVSQSDSLICWAACIASISKYVNNVYYTSSDVANIAYRNGYTSAYNQGLTGRQTAKLMDEIFNLSYQYISSAPTDTVIINNLRNDYPVIGAFEYGAAIDDWHDAVIYGIDTNRDYLLIMDPGYDYVTAWYTSDGYQYIDDLDREMTLGEGICYSL